jgi:hypothetical protein
MVSALAACATSGRIGVFKEGDDDTAKRRALMVGRWYGEALLEGGGTRRWIADRSSNGRLRIQFDIKSPSKRFQQIEFGRWGVSGKVYFTILEGWEKGSYIEEADPEDASIYDAYEITKITENVMEYRSYETKESYTLKKVSEEFQMPKDA